MKKVIIISVSSDIGIQLCEHWCEKSWEIVGTYRKPPTSLRKRKNLTLIPCDLLNQESINEAIEKMKISWDVLVFLSGQLEPIGKFKDVDFDSWERSYQINCIQPLKILHSLIPYKKPCSTVLFFAGGGVNSAPKNHSSYTLSKVTLVKMCELLDAEIDDANFVILGPGWVKTKIHKQVLNAGYEKAQESYCSTLEKFSTNTFVPMSWVIKACDWIIENSSRIISGRNFSIPSQGHWNTKALLKALEEDEHMYKLRRANNSWHLNM